MRHLILGGARSGKSHHAQSLAQASGREVVMVVTATAGDEEMAARIAAHRASRPAAWQVVEAPLALAEALASVCAPQRFVIVDCLTLWLTNLLIDRDAHPDGMALETAALLAVLPTLPGEVALVSNEVGWGVVPMGALTREFVDEAGRLNQRIAALCERVTLVAAGLPLVLKGAR